MSKRRNDRKELRRKMLLEKLVLWQKLTPMEQLVQLDKRLGEGVGAIKQRARLVQLIKKSKLSKKQ